MFARTATRLTLVLTAATATVALSGCAMLTQFLPTSEPERDDAGTIVEGDDRTDVFSLRVGDCTNDPETMTDQVASAETVPCSEPHDNEVYHAADLSGDEYPGEEDVSSQANQLCYDAFEPFIGMSYEESIYDFGSMNPSAGSWADGDREVLCLAYAVDLSPITGTLEGVAE